MLPLQIAERVVSILAASSILNVFLIIVLVSLLIDENLGCIFTILMLALISGAFLTFSSFSLGVFWVFFALYSATIKVKIEFSE